MKYNYETTYIPHHFLYYVSEKYCTNFKPLFMPKSTYFHRFPYFYLNMESQCEWMLYNTMEALGVAMWVRLSLTK